MQEANLDAIKTRSPYPTDDSEEQRIDDAVDAHFARLASNTAACLNWEAEHHTTASALIQVTARFREKQITADMFQRVAIALIRRTILEDVQ